MGLWGNTAEQPPEKKKHANISADQLNSNQQAVPVKYLAGRQYVAGDYISPAYNPIAQPVKTKTGKSETSTTGYKYFADFALVFCMGGRQPVDAVYKVIIDNDIVWKGNITRTVGVNKEIITLPNDRGVIHLYWGTETQGIDNVLLTPRGLAGELGSDPQDNTTWPAAGGFEPGDPNPYSGHYDKHPAYRGQCYAVFKKFKLGRDRTQVPNIQLELKRGCPWFSSASISSDNRGVSPIAVLFDWLTDTRFGMGVPESMLDSSTFTNTYAALENLGPARISPLITAQEDFRQVVAELLEYYDGWIRRNGTMIEVGYWSHGSNISPVATLLDDDLLAEPELEPQGWGPTLNEVTIVYKDRDHHFNDYTQIHRDPNNFRITGGPRPETLQRPWLTDKDLAKQYAKESGSSLAMPFTRGDLTVKREWLSNNGILPGVVISYNSGFYGLSFWLRVLEIEYAADNAASAKMTVDWERSKWPGVYVPPGFQGPGGFFTGPRALLLSVVGELPYNLGGREFVTQVVALAVRGNVEVHGYRIWASFDSGVTYQQLPDSASTSGFASLGYVTIDFGAAAADFWFMGYGIDQDTVVSQTPGQQADDNLLCFMGNEMVSIGAITPGAAPQLNAEILRGRYATTPGFHSVNNAALFIYRSQLLLLDHVGFVPGATILFKLQAFTEDLDYDLASITPISYTIVGFGDIPAPVFYPAPGDFVTSIAVGVTDPTTGIVTRYTTDGSGVTLASELWPQSAGINTTITITNATTFRVRYFAPDGRYSNETIGIYTSVPDLSTVSGTPPPPPPNQVGLPKWSFSGTLNYTSGSITLTNTTSGATIKYSKNGGATTNYSSPVALACTSTGDKIEFWAIKAGLTDSPHKTVNNKSVGTSGGGWLGGGSTGTPPRILQ
jgi:hypothetical protein